MSIVHIFVSKHRIYGPDGCQLFKIQTVTTLSIKITSPDSGEGHVNVQELEITHLAVTEMDAAALRAPRRPSPGIVIIAPQIDSFTLIIDGKPVAMVPGVARVLPGEATWHLAPSSGQDRGSGNISLKIVEFNALLNAALSLREVLILPALLSQNQSEEIERLWDDLMRDEARLMLAPGQPGLCRHLCTARLMEFLLASASVTRAPVNMAEWDNTILKLKAFLIRNLAYSTSTEDMAEHLGISRSSLYRQVVPVLGCSPAQYMRRLRLEKCQEIIRNSSLSIKQIAEITGFSSHQHMWREFTKEYAITPAQLRRSIKAERQGRSAERVEVLIRNQRYEEALSICENNLQARAPKGPPASHTQEQQARCLYAMGRVSEALSIWQELGDGPEAYPAGKQLCNHYYRCGEFERASNILAALFPKATDAQANQLILRWCHQVAALVARRKSGPLPAYLEVRARYFLNNARSMYVAAEAFKGLGQEHRVIEECQGLPPERRRHSLRRAGLYSKAIEGSGNGDHNSIVSTLLLLGRYEEALDVGVDDPATMAKALTRMGREIEAIQLYPDLCQEAYLSLGRYQELLDRWPEPSEYRILALSALGRTGELQNYPDPHDLLPQFLLGPDQFLAVSNPRQPEYRIPALAWKAIQLLAAGQPEEAEAFLAKISLVESPDFWVWPDPSCHETILTTVTRGFAGHRDLAQSELKSIFAKLKYTDYQRTWHDAGFLLGKITTDTYRDQPCQADLDSRLAVISALKDDWNGQASADMYQSLLAGLPNISLLKKPQLRALFEWRLKVAARSKRLRSIHP